MVALACGLGLMSLLFFMTLKEKNLSCSTFVKAFQGMLVIGERVSARTPLAACRRQLQCLSVICMTLSAVLRILSFFRVINFLPT